MYKILFLFLIVVNSYKISAQFTENNKDIHKTKNDILYDKYEELEFDNKLSTVVLNKEYNDSPLFNHKIIYSNYIFDDNISLKIDTLVFEDCLMYEYTNENLIDSITKEVFSELGFIKEGKVVLKYQIKDLFSNSAYYREISIIKNPDYFYEVYPNPFTKYLLFKTANIIIYKESIKIFTLNGHDVSDKVEIIEDEGVFNIKFSEKLKKGVYFLRASVGNVSIVEKLIYQ